LLLLSDWLSVDNPANAVEAYASEVKQDLTEDY
jgi:hypothetical protein